MWDKNWLQLVNLTRFGWADIRKPFTQGDFLVPSFRAEIPFKQLKTYQTAKKMQRACATILIVIFFSKSTNIHQSKNGI